MRHFLVALMLFASPVFAQTVDVKDVNTTSNGEETTTIEIKKGKKEDMKKSEALWEISEGTADVEGEVAPTSREAKQTWKKSCDDWKKEFRADNKENKILALNCGSPSCGGDNAQKTCTSQATYKIKTKIN